MPQEVIGVLPAAGRATRIAPLPCSKELLPVGLRPADHGQGVSPKVVCHYLLEKMRLAGISRAYIILGNGKWDIPAYLADGTLVGLHLAYLVTPPTRGVPYTVDQAHPFIQDALVAFGFPDIMFQPQDVFSRLLSRQASTRADIVLALFPAHDPAQMDMVDVDDRGRVRGILLKPPHTHLSYAWICAVWTPAFTDFMHEYLTRDHEGGNQSAATSQDPDQRELTMGTLLHAGIEHRLSVDSVAFPDVTYLDIGTPTALQKVLGGGRLSPLG
jgi:glucose-1-phosphate thymidylyltransferase